MVVLLFVRKRKTPKLFGALYDISREGKASVQLEITGTIATRGEQWGFSLVSDIKGLNEDFRVGTEVRIALEMSLS